ncbi:MAG: hypothetical protein ACRD68_19120, partial [Pyrinomonadaceae bacterium]
MALFEGKTTAERNKTILALVLGAFALFVLVRGLFPSSSSTNTNRAQGNTNRRRATTAGSPQQQASQQPDADGVPEEVLATLRPVNCCPQPPNVPAAGRNIFAYYVPPPPAQKTDGAGSLPPATPTPTPPLLLASLNPSNVYARTGEFPLQVSGDKFTPQSRVYVDSQEVPTRFAGPQQLSANVPAAFTSSPGARQVTVRTPDGLLYSNSATLNVAQPPAPAFTYVGLLGRRRANDTALLKDQKNELLSVQRGDVVGGRFRVTSISQSAVEFTDQQLKIKHSLPYTEGRASGGTGSI